MAILLKGCSRCHGDLTEDEGDWQCFQCGQYYYNNPDPPIPLLDSVGLGKAPTMKKKRRERRGRWSSNVPTVQTYEERVESLRLRHPGVVGWLEEGKSVPEISSLTGVGPRTIRAIREQMSLSAE